MRGFALLFVGLFTLSCGSGKEELTELCKLAQAQLDETPGLTPADRARLFYPKAQKVLSGDRAEMFQAIQGEGVAPEDRARMLGESADDPNFKCPALEELYAAE